MISSTRRPALTLAAVVVAVGLTTAACGSDATPKAKPTPTQSAQTQVPVPTGVTLTEYGSELKFGETATVAYVANPQRKTILELSVQSASQGRITDLANFSLEDRVKESTVYYVRVSVKNVGTGDVGKSPIPLYLVDNHNLLLQRSKFENAPFTKCPSLPLPTTFGPNASMSTCLVFLAPDHGQMTGVSFRPDQANAPIVWKGVVKTPALPKKTTKKAS